MLSDYHVHSNLSFDSNEDAENIVKKAIELNMDEICFTEHHDIGWFYEGNTSLIDIDAYNKTIDELRNKYSDKIKILKGIEIGITKENIDDSKQFLKDNNFDFVIGSFHELNGADPYYPGFWDDKNDEEVINDYFTTTYDLLRDFGYVDALGHLDYVVRYCPNRDKNYNPDNHWDILDQILTLLIERDIALEINTANLAKGFDFAHPHPKIIERYKKLGGKKFTIGSDAHDAEHVGYDFDKVKGLFE